jgi:hypothetical protein
MGKAKDVLDKMKPNSLVRLQPKDIQKRLEKIWKDWEAFAEYALISRTLPVMHGLPIKQLI